MQINKKKIVVIIVTIIIVCSALIILLNYNEKSKTYSITYLVNNQIILVQPLEDLKEPLAPEKEGCKFIGWYYKNKKFDFSQEIKKNITLEAKYEKLKTELYKITIEINEKKYIYETNEAGKLHNIDNPKKKGYTFKGWFDGKNYIDITQPFYKDTSLKAIFTKDITEPSQSIIENNNQKDQNSNEDIINEQEEKEYKVKFVVENIIIKEEIIKENETIILPQSPTKEGYTFKGWYSDNKEVTSNLKVTGNMTIISKWDTYTYSIELIENDSFSVNRLINIYKNNKIIKSKAIYGNYNNIQDYKLGVYSENYRGIKILSYEQFKKSNNYLVELENGTKVFINEKK